MTSLKSRVASTYRGLRLDPFQAEAIGHLERRESVLVSAPTGTGKTLIADYVIEKCHRKGRKVVYTAPIKALGNQKFKEFKRLLGAAHVGILTGDVVIQPEASVLIMTTEIFRNLLHAEPDRLSDVAYCIFDEIHYIDDPARGSVWEESLIFMPPQMRFLGLSATIPNVDELAAWIGSIHGRDVQVVRHTQRAVPLEHHLFESSLGFCSLDQLRKRYRRHARRFGTTERGRITASFAETTHLDLIEEVAPAYLPLLFFTFSRRRCETHAAALARQQTFLDAGEQEAVRKVLAEAEARYGHVGRQSLQAIEPLLLRGIGYHHAGLLPVVKDVVEDLFEQRLLNVLYCTETFAVGLNFPCRSVCFEAVTKWDGTRFRALSNREYFQMAGRAGRRGIDTAGHAFTVVDFNYFNPAEFPSMREDEIEPLRSRFTLTYNSVLNLVRQYGEPEIARLLQQNFASYQTRAERAELERRLEGLDASLPSVMGCELMAGPRCPLTWQAKAEEAAELKRRLSGKDMRGRSRKAKAARRTLHKLEQATDRDDLAHCDPAVVGACSKLKPDFDRLKRRRSSVKRALAQLAPADAHFEAFAAKRALLEAMDYIRDGELTARGRFAAEINGAELLITEVYCSGVFHELSIQELAALATTIDYEPRRNREHRRRKSSGLPFEPLYDAAHLVRRMEEQFIGWSDCAVDDSLALSASHWCEGASFADVVAKAGVDEGDVVYAFRRGIDVLRQVRHAAREDTALTARLRETMNRMDRDEVSILL